MICLSVDSVMWKRSRMEIRSNICATLIKTPQNLTLSDFFDNVPDGEFGVALMSLLIYTIFNHQIFLDSVDFCHFCGFGGAREQRI